ncbi:hypothetical protein F5144DRAFT_659308, partial [Chaetomium tenue]
LTAALQTQCPWNPTIPPLQPAGSCTLPVDDGTPALLNSSRGLPWTHPPSCIIPNAAGSTEKFCVYSSSTFNDGSGIAIITDPETAAGVADTVQDPLPAWNSRHHLARRGRLSTEAVDLPYTVTQIPGKGLGVVATKRIKRFDTILKSYPAMIADNEFLSLGKKTEGGLPGGPRLFQKALDQLPDKERFLTMARSEEEHVHAVEDVIKTNAFGIIVDGRDMKGVYPEIAHTGPGLDADQFSAYSKFTKKDLAMSAIATRDIEPGEEITVSCMPTAHRTRALKNWGFNCTCNLCSASAEARSASDERRERLAEAFHTMQHGSVSYNTLVKLTQELVDLAQVEGLLAKVGEYYQAFMRTYYGAGDAETARKYGRASLKLAEIFSDPEGVLCTGLKGDLEQLDRLIQAGTV